MGATTSPSTFLSHPLDFILSQTHHFSSSKPSLLSLHPKPPLHRALCLPPTAFLDSPSLSSLQTLQSFRYSHGPLEVRLMAPDDLGPTVSLLADSFADAMWMPRQYVTLLEFLVKQYVVEKRRVLPHAATLVGFYKEEGEEKERLAATAEVSFDELGMNVTPPTPLPPRDCPYICNMTVKKELRRRGIGWHLLKACEELISQMSEKQEIYLHCRVIDEGPFNMYKKAGYEVVKKDSILVWLTLQRRKNLMCKKRSARVDKVDSTPN